MVIYQLILKNYLIIVHFDLHNVIKRTFGILKVRFPLLTTASPYAIETQVKIVLTYCILLNEKTSQIGFLITCKEKEVQKKKNNMYVKTDF